jgi:hypothetical protein
MTGSRPCRTPWWSGRRSVPGSPTSPAGRSWTACGTGFYSRLYKRLGAETVVGVGIVPGMVDIARAVEDEAPLGISYEVADVATLGTLGEFDVVTPIWALPYARNADEYHEMTLNCANNLVSGGTMVALCDNPDIDVAGMSVYPRYGLTITPTDDVGDLRVVHIQMESTCPPGTPRPAAAPSPTRSARRVRPLASSSSRGTGCRMTSSTGCTVRRTRSSPCPTSRRTSSPTGRVCPGSAGSSRPRTHSTRRRRRTCARPSRRIRPAS